MRHIIIGGGIAGISASRAIRGRDKDAEITMISGEKAKAYYRPMIPYLIEKEGMDINFLEDPVEKYGIGVVYEKAAGVDAKSKEVILSSGERLNFDKLLIATGSSPVIPDIRGLGGKGVFTLRTMEDALGIREYCRGREDAVVLGGGLVGIKAAISLKHSGLNVTIIEKLEEILDQRLDKRGSRIISKVLLNGDIGVLTGDTIEEVIRKRDMVEAVRLSSGKVIKADIVIVAAGVRPDVDVLKNSGIKTGNGVLINEYLQTCMPDIYAAGDVVEYRDLITGMLSINALWTNAEEMGRLAGKNMTGENIRYSGFLSVMNATDISGIPVIAVGIIDPDTEGYEVITDDRIDSYRKLVFRDDFLVGIIFIGDLTNAGIYTNLIKNKIPVGRLKEEAIKGNLGYINFIRKAPFQTITV
ncbi:MAG: FAD-dependent oxidoreductase [Nitrospirota bacterium]|nr:FAD-dependent oxidoreductase [Nitrospirota bacterium]